MARIVSVNVGRPQDRAWAGLGYTSIDKRPVAGAVRAHVNGLIGDVVSDTKHHGGAEQAVYAFAREDLDSWGRRLGAVLRDGQFGENLTTEGIDVNEAEIGEHWRIGSVLLEVCSVRTPCNDFKNWIGVAGYDNSRWVKRFAEEARPGPYLRVLEEGSLCAGDEIEVVRRPGHGITVTTLFTALNLDRSLLPSLLTADGSPIAGLGDKPRQVAQEYVAS